MKTTKNMQTNVSLVTKDGKIQARLNYKDQDLPENIYIEAFGEDIEEVIEDLYNKMTMSINNLLAESKEELKEEEEKLDNTEYIKKLETQIEQLMKENAILKQKKEVTKKSPWYTYNTVKIPSVSVNFQKDFKDFWEEFFE